MAAPTDEVPLVSSNGRDKYGTTTDEEDFVSTNQPKLLHFFEIVAILSTAFSYGCVMTTLFLITLPVECKRIQHEHPTVQKSISLAIFVAIAGVTQLVSPLIGRLSDTYKPPTNDIGQRMPYLVLGAIITVIGLLGQGFSSAWSFWIRYSVAFFLHMIGLNIIYSMMITLIPDQVPESQTGVANGILALLIVTGALFGFGLFNSVLGENILSMYGLYTCIVIGTTILTCSYAHERDVEKTHVRKGDAESSEDGRPRILNPFLLIRSMLIDPIRQLDWKTLQKSYTIDASKYHDFFIVTVSRTFYYMGISVQTFFLYFLTDIIHVKDNPESAVAILAIFGQCAGALTCYPVGMASDKFFHGRRKPFVYFACAILASATLSTIFMSDMHHMVIASCLLGGANGIYLTMDTSLAVDTLPIEQQDDPDGCGHAQLLGVWGVAGFVGSALGPLVGGPLLYAFGNPTLSPEGEVEYSIQGYSVCFSMSALYFLISALILRLIRNESV
jgi:MFS family permease